MNTVYLFDVDGTLSPARKAMDPGFAYFFTKFVRLNNVYLISGSDYQKIREQVPEHILQLCNGVFGCSGAEYLEKGKVVYRKKHEFDPRIINICETFVADSLYHARFGNHIEFRTGMINVTSVGRLAGSVERHAYFRWDQRHNERAKLLKNINQQNIGYEASAGGEISVDIVPTGWNKSVAKREVLRMIPRARMFFFGDRMEPDGNDYPLAVALSNSTVGHRSIAVKSFEDTWTHLQKIQSDTGQLAA